jgi:hypothetical protein
VTPRCIIVLGTMGSDPYAGMAWMHMQIALGLQRLGHDVYYFETTSRWPYDPVRESHVGDSDYTLPYLERVLRKFGLEHRWAYRRSYGDKSWFGMSQMAGEDLLAHADAVINVTGSTRVAEEGLKVGRMIYLGTDPVVHEIGFQKGEEAVLTIVQEHQDFVTYGENIGTALCPLPPLPGLRARTRQPVLLDLWETERSAKEKFTTVCNWRQDGKIEFRGETYYWSKDREFGKFLELPGHIEQPLELAIGMRNLPAADRSRLQSNGWKLTDAHGFTTDPWTYRDYIWSSHGEFTVAKDQNVRLRTGWFSERSACYLAAGRPVITQDTGFGTVLPTGEGLFAFNTMDEILAAFEAVRTDYTRHSRAAHDIAQEYFRAETVLKRLLEDLGL